MRYNGTYVECTDADTLGALIANALGEAERAAIAVHAAACEQCHALLDGLLDERANAPTQDSSGTRAPLKVGAGTRVGRYVIEERLGAGGMGVVYAAVDSELHRRVAVKLLRPDDGGELGTQGRERLMREARMLASLSHPNVVTVFDVGTHEANLFLAMELVEGGNLNAWLRRARRTTEEIVDRLIEAGRGLSAAHATGVVHRDVKPDNILVGADGRARVTDFGLARFERAQPEAPELDVPSQLSPNASPLLTRTGTLMGTPVYMAPEQMSSGEAEPRTDQWSFCAMVYEVIGGVRPFPIEDRDARTAAIAAGRLSPPVRAVPSWIARIVARGLRANPGERWPSMDAVVDALVRGRRRRGQIARWIAIAAAVALASTASLVLAMRGGGKHGDEPIRMADMRGCGCPMSACTQKCASVCTASEYAVGARLPGVSLPNRQEALLGASLDADVVLYLADKGCVLDRVWLARRRGDTYVPVDLTDQLDRARVAVFEGCCTLAPDGKSMLLARPDRRGFVRVMLSESGTADRGTDVGELLPANTPGVTLEFPTLSPDQLTLYYRSVDRSQGPGDQGPLDGVFAAVRADAAASFTPGTRLPGRARYYDVVSGVSSDHLSLFMFSEYRTHVLVRDALDKPFGDPALGMLPALLPGWRTVPTRDCQHLLTTWTPGGCAAEDIIWLDAVR
jgi:predicted Ser/Thr protein kinase